MKAVVLCAGYGTRLGSLTRETPKPMLPICGAPLLAYTLRYLAFHGYGQIAINLHFKPEMFIKYFGDGSRFGVELTYSYEKKLLGTAGALRNLGEFLGNADDFLVVYGDLLIDQNLTRMLDSHREKKADATLLLHLRERSNSVVQVDDQYRVVAFAERPTDEERGTLASSGWVNSGLQILNHRILEFIPPEGPADLPKDVYIPILGQESIYGFPLTGYRCAIDSPERYAEAQAAVAQGRYEDVTAHTAGVRYARRWTTHQQ